MNTLLFYSQVINLTDCFVAIMPKGITSIEQLKSEIMQRLNFPEEIAKYSNWDAITDNLSELYWINSSEGFAKK
jgi:hypothetical protein